MDSLEEFRNDVRTWLQDNCPESQRQPVTPEEQYWGGRRGSFASDDARVWFERMRDQGWIVPEWPVEFGGAGLGEREAKVIKEEMKSLRARLPLYGLGIWMLGPALLEYGSTAQKEQHLRAIVNGELRWAQGYSEPGAGSDLASLQCKAEDMGDHFLVNGSKIWTTAGDRCDWIFCLVRTDPTVKKQEGISFLLIDLESPGITITPIVSLDGQVEQCQVFFDAVKVPCANLVGAENDGWSVAKSLLEFERGGHNFTIDVKKQLRKIHSQAKLTPWGEKTRAADPVFQHRLAEAEIDALALEHTELRIKGAVEAGGNPGALSSLVKVVGTELGQRLNELSIDLVGPAAAPQCLEALDPNHKGDTPVPEHALTAMAEYINNRAATIYGGTAEIQRTIIAKKVLGL